MFLTRRKQQRILHLASRNSNKHFFSAKKETRVLMKPSWSVKKTPLQGASDDSASIDTTYVSGFATLTVPICFEGIFTCSVFNKPFVAGFDSLLITKTAPTFFFLIGGFVWPATIFEKYLDTWRSRILCLTSTTGLSGAYCTVGANTAIHRLPVNVRKKYHCKRYFHKPKKINKRAVIYFDKLKLSDAKLKLINLLDELYGVSNDFALYNNNAIESDGKIDNTYILDKYNFLKKGIHLQFGTVHNKKVNDSQRHLLYISMIELLTKLDVIYKTKFGDENVPLDEFLELEKKFVDSQYKINVNKRLPTIFIPSHGLQRYNVNRSNEAMASILLYNTGIRYFGLLSIISTVTYIIPKVQGYIS